MEGADGEDKNEVSALEVADVSSTLRCDRKKKCVTALTVDESIQLISTLEYQQ